MISRVNPKRRCRLYLVEMASGCVYFMHLSDPPRPSDPSAAACVRLVRHHAVADHRIIEAERSLQGEWSATHRRGRGIRGLIKNGHYTNQLRDNVAQDANLDDKALADELRRLPDRADLETAADPLVAWVLAERSIYLHTVGELVDSQDALIRLAKREAGWDVEQPENTRTTKATPCR